MDTDKDSQLQRNQEQNSLSKPFKDMRGMPPAVRLLNPQTLPWGVLLLIIYLILAFLTKDLPDDIFSQIIGSIRLLFLTMGLFFTLMGILGLIVHPNEKAKAIPKIPKFLKKREE